MKWRGEGASLYVLDYDEKLRVCDIDITNLLIKWLPKPNLPYFELHVGYLRVLTHIWPKFLISSPSNKNINPITKYSAFY